MTDLTPTHPTERAAAAARRRVKRKTANRQRATWALVSLIVLALLVGVVALSSRSSKPTAANTPDGETVPAATVPPPPEPSTDDARAPAKSSAAPAQPPIKSKPRQPPPLEHEKADPPAVIRLVLPAAPPVVPKVPDPSDKVVNPPKTAPQTEPAIELVEASFFDKPLPVVNPGTLAPGRPVTLIEFPRPPKGLTLALHGIDHLTSTSRPTDGDSRPKVTAVFAATDQTLVVRDETSGSKLGEFFLQKKELRFRWKPRASLSAIQRNVRDLCVLHAAWEGHPGRYYALHDQHIRSARRVRDQQVRMRSSELPTGLNSENLFLGSGKLELADVYSHDFLTTPLATRAEIPTLKRSREDPPLFVEIAWKNASLSLNLDAPINSEDEARRRKKLYQHVDGGFFMHASLYRVVDKKIKVEVLRLGMP